MKNRLNLLKSIAFLAAPAIVEMSLNTALIVADTIMVSKFLGGNALSAVGIANSIMFTLIFVFSSFNIGAVAMISRSFGEKNIEKARDIAQTNIVLNLIIGLIISLIAYLLRPLLFSPFMITIEVRNLLNTYFDIVIAGMVFQFMSFAFSSLSRGSGDTKTPMYLMAFSVVLNIILNYLLILGVGAFPKMGIAGAALATTISRIVAFLIYIFLFFSGRHILRLSIKRLKINKDILKPLWNISYPGAIEQFLFQSAFFIVGIIVTSLPTSSEALFRIVANIESTSFMPAVGISIAAATLVGNALGEKDVKKAYEIGFFASIMSLLWGLTIGMIFFFLPSPILKIFTSNEALITMGIPVLLIIGFNQPLLNYTIAMSGALRGAGDTKFVMHLTTLRLWTIFLPGSFITIIYLNTGIVGTWYAEILSFIVFSILLFGRFKSQKWANFKF